MKGDLRRKVLWGFGIAIVLCPCSLCGIGLYGYQSIFGAPARQLPRELDLARKEGIPLDPDDLRPKPPVKDEQNAATIYRAFFPRIDRLVKEHRDLINECNAIAKGEATHPQEQEVRAALNEAGVHESLVEIAAGSKRPYCDFHYSYEDGPTMRMPELAMAKMSARLMNAHAHLLASDGKLSEALDDIASSFALGRQIAKAPLLIAYLVAVAIEDMAVEELCHLIDLSRARPDLLAKAEHTIEESKAVVDLKVPCGFEVVMGRIALHMVHSVGDLRQLTGSVSGNGDNPSASGGGPRLPDSVMQGYEAHYVAAWRRVFESLPTDPGDWLGDYLALKPIDEQISSDRSVGGIMNTILFPSLQGIALSTGHLDANRRIASTAILLMEDRLRTGSYPAKLPNFGRSALDPFDGKPLRYTREGSGFKIYSIDRDFKDDGGRAWKGSEGGDLVREFR